MRIGWMGKLLLLGAGGLLSSSALAVCKYNSGGASANGYTYVAFDRSIYDLKFYHTDYTVPLDAVPGTVLFEITLNNLPDTQGMDKTNPESGAYISLVNCPGGTEEVFSMQRQELADFPKTYPTGVSNIGYRAYYPGLSDPGPNVNTAVPAEYGSTLFFPALQPKIEFVLLSHDWSGNRQVPSGYLLARVDAAGRTDLMKYSLGNAIRFTPEPCKFVTEATMRVDLEPVPLEAVPPIGERYKTEDVSLEMQCPKNYLPPSVAFSATPYGAPTTGLLANEHATPAEGVAVLLEYLSAGVPRAADLSGTNKVTQFTALGDCGDACQRLGLDLQVSYMRTLATITPGDISSRVTITVQHN